MGVFKMGSWKENALWGSLLVSMGTWGLACAEADDETVDLPVNASLALTPIMVVDSPQRAFIGQLDAVEVSGHIEHWNTNAELFINDQLANVSPDGRFSIMNDMDKGINFIHAQIVDDDKVLQEDKRSILNATQIPINTAHEDALFLNLGENIFNHVGDLAQLAITNTDFAEEFGNQLISGNGGCSNSVWFRNLTFDDIDFEFDFEPGRLNVGLRVQEPLFSIRTRIARDTFFGCIRDTTNASISSNEISILISYQVGTDENNEPFIEFENVDAAFDGFDLDVSGYPDPFIEWLTGDVSEDLEQEIEETIEEESIEALDGILKDMLPGVFSSDVGSSRITSTPHLSKFAADAHGLTLSYGMTSEVEENDPLSTYWSVGPQEPSPLPTPHPERLDYGISLEILNQLLAMSWQNGVFNQTIAAKDIPMDFNPDDEDLKDASFNLKLQPVIRHDDEYGGLVFEMGEAQVEIESTHGEVLLEMALAIRANIGFSRNEETGFIMIDKNDFIGHSSVTASNKSDVSALLVDALIEFELDTALAEVNKILRNFEIEGALYSESDEDDGSFGFRTSESHLWFQIDPSILFPL